MPDALATALIAAGSAIVGSLLTIFLTPRIQHVFWIRQQRAQLRLQAIAEFNRLTAEFLHQANPYVPAPQWFIAFNANEATIRASFSGAGDEAFQALRGLIGPGQGGTFGPQGQYGVHDFIERRDRALTQFYSEVY